MCQRRNGRREHLLRVICFLSSQKTLTLRFCNSRNSLCHKLLQVPLSLDCSDIPVFFLEPREPRKRSMYFKDHSSPTRRRYRFSSTAPRSPYSSRRTNRLVRQLVLGKRLKIGYKYYISFQGMDSLTKI